MTGVQTCALPISIFNLRETIPEPKIVRKVLRSLPERFHAKITTIEESTDIDKIPLTEFVGNLQTYELGLTRIGKSSKGKSMTLRPKAVTQMSLQTMKILR